MEFEPPESCQNPTMCPFYKHCNRAMLIENGLAEVKRGDPRGAESAKDWANGTTCTHQQALDAIDAAQQLP
jgi:hypothetical protein